MGKKLSGLAVDADAESLTEMIENCAKFPGSAGSTTARLRTQSGVEVVCQLNVSSVLEGDRVVGINVFGRRMQTENAIMGSMHMSAQLLDELLTFVHMMVMAFDPAGKIIVYNRTVEEVLARSSSDVLGSTIFDLIDREEINKDEVVLAVQEVLSGRTRMLRAASPFQPWDHLHELETDAPDGRHWQHQRCVGPDQRPHPGGPHG